MQEGIHAVYEELERLKREGTERVFLSDEALDHIRNASAATPRPAAEKAKSGAKEVSSPKPDHEPAVALQPEKAPAQKPAPQKVSAYPPPPVIDLPEGDPATRLAWLRERVENCPTCKEHLSKSGKIVFGDGAVDADIFFCGEAPGAEEELAGEPFVGAAGQLLTKIIDAMGLKREAVYIANILKWRPEHDKPYGNRPPTEDEMAFCLPYLKAQIEIIRPKVIVALGNTALTGLLGPDPDRRMSKVRGQWHEFAGIPLMVTYHPSYLLRSGTLKTKRDVWEDMMAVMEKAGLPVSEKQRGYFLKK